MTLTHGILYAKSKVLVGQTSFLLYQTSHVLEKMLFFSSDPCDIKIIFRGLDFLIPLMAPSPALQALGSPVSHPTSREMISFILMLPQESTEEGGLVAESSSLPPKSQTQT